MSLLPWPLKSSGFTMILTVALMPQLVRLPTSKPVSSLTYRCQPPATNIPAKTELKVAVPGGGGGVVVMVHERAPVVVFFNAAQKNPPEFVGFFLAWGIALPCRQKHSEMEKGGEG